MQKKSTPPYDTLGQFISSIAYIEFVLNTSIESILDNQKLIDHLQNLPVDLRIEFLKSYLDLAKNTYIKFNVPLSDNIANMYDSIIKGINELTTCYSDCKGTRNLIAHSPLFTLQPKEEDVKHRVVSSRRYKPKGEFNSLDIDNIQKLNSMLIPKMNNFNKLLNDIIVYCHQMYEIKEVRRQITK